MKSKIKSKKTKKTLAKQSYRVIAYRAIDQEQHHTVMATSAAEAQVKVKEICKNHEWESTAVRTDHNEIVIIAIAGMVL